jgi:hypothetical protein
MTESNVNQPNNQPWLVLNVIAALVAVQPLPKHPKNLLPKFDPDRKDSNKDHIKKIVLIVRLLNVEHEDVIFPFLIRNVSPCYTTKYTKVVYISLNFIPCFF